MNKLSIIFVALMLVLQGCLSEIAPTEQSLLPVDDSSSDGETVALTSIPFEANEALVIEQLASNLKLDPSEISLISNTEVEFPDSCLGVSMQDTMCAQVITPGNSIVLEADGFEFEYHVSENGRIVQPATVAVTWKREGGIAGFCNGMTVFLSGEVYANDCRSQPDEVIKVFSDLFTSEEQKQFFVWSGKFGDLEMDDSDPEGVADRMIITMEFHGIGSQQPSDAEKQSLLEFVQDLYQKLYS